MRINNAIEKVYIIFFVILIMSKFKPKNVYIFGGAIQLNQTVQLNIWPQFNETYRSILRLKAVASRLAWISCLRSYVFIRYLVLLLLNEYLPV